MKLFSTIPFFRILIPFIAGILVALALECPPVSYLYCSLLLLLVLPVFYKASKTALLVVADLFLMVYGITLVSQSSLQHNPLFYGNKLHADSVQCFIAVINDVPVEKQNSIKCELKLAELKSAHGYVPVKGTIIGYFKRSPGIYALKAGSVVLVKAKLTEVPAPLNPFEFDYKNYLQFKQIHHIAFINPGAFATVPGKKLLNPVWQAGLQCKQMVMERLRSGGLSQNAYAICCALLTGYDDEIDRSVMDAFSHSGTLHVLSVSGLHTGLIYLVLVFLFDLADRKRQFKVLRFYVIAVILWLFALMTGFSAPVLRAVIMFNLFGLGTLYFRNDGRNQMNILLASAFILLCYNPFFITDVGFLLSYFALAGLIYFQPVFSAWWLPSNRIMNYAWQSITASAAATLSTLPLTLFYFKQFPIWFFVCNLVVVPATFVMLLLAVLLVCRLIVAGLIINKITAWLIAFIHVFNLKGMGFIDNIHFNFPDVVFLSLVIIAVSVTFQNRSFRMAALSLVIIIFWQFSGLISSFRAKQQSLLTVYQLKDKSLISVKNKTGVYLSSNDPLNYNFHVRPQLITFNYPDPAVQPFNHITAQGQEILVLDKENHWPLISPGTITTLVLCNNFKLTASGLSDFKRLKTIVADGSNNSYAIKKAQELSRKFGFDFYITRLRGAYLLTL